MSPTPFFREELISQIPALQLLPAMGYTYLTTDELSRSRDFPIASVVANPRLEIAPTKSGSRDFLIALTRM